jgi:DNA-binding GntR family transcriptional regulator
LRCLQSEGWIEFLPNRGARVSGLSASEGREIYEIRASLERTALELAFPRHNEQSWRDAGTALQAALKEKQRPRYVQRNREFHLALYRPAQRPHLLGLIESLHKRGERYLRLKLEMPFHKRKSDDEHEQILAACRQGDLDTALRILTGHLLETGAMLADYLQRGPQPLAPR